MFRLARKAGPSEPAPPAGAMGYQLETGSDLLVDPVDAASLHTVLTELARTGDFFVVGDNANSMCYIQGYTNDSGATWQMEYQEGDLADHWATEVAGGDVERIVLTWMSTRDVRRDAVWTRTPL